MNPPPGKHRTIPKLFFVLILAIVAISIVYTAIHANDWSWPVPEEAKHLKNPLRASEDALKSAKSIYKEKCANCHGDAGKGDGPDAARYEPGPADFSDAKRMSNVTDGELFYKISEGKKPMPVFKTKLTEEQRWQLVLLIRSLAASASGSH